MTVLEYLKDNLLFLETDLISIQRDIDELNFDLEERQCFVKTETNSLNERLYNTSLEIEEFKKVIARLEHGNY